MIFTYCLQSVKDDSYYVGISSNPKQRLIVHNKGGLKVTRFKRPWKLIYQKEHTNYIEARKHEKWLKKKNHQYKAKLAG